MIHRKSSLFNILLTVAAAAAVLSLPAHADSYTWSGGGGNDDWSTGANWTDGVPPASAADTFLEFDGSTRLTPNTDAAWDLGSITFNSGAGAFTLTGTTINLAESGTVANNSANTQTITNSSVNLPGVSTWDTSGGDLFVSSVITGNPEFFFQTGSVVKTGAGTLTFAGANTYGEGTTVRSGTLAIVSGGVINNTSAVVAVGESSGDVGAIVIDGGELRTQSFIIGDGGSTGSVIMNDGVFDSSSQVLIGGGFAGAGVGSFEVHGGNLSSFGTIFIGYAGTGSMTMTGGTLVSQNGISVGANDGTGTFNVSGGSLTFDGGTSISAGSSLTISGSTSYTLAGMYVDGELTINGGVVTGTSQGGIGSGGQVGVVTVNGGTWTQTGEMFIGLGGTGTLNVNGGYVSTTNTLTADTLIGVFGNGIVNVSSGTWAHGGNLSVGGYDYMGMPFGGTGTIAVSGGLMDVSGTLFLGNGSGTGTLTISGSSGNRGVVSANSVVAGTGTATLTVNGGVLQAKGDEVAFLSGFQAGDVTVGEEGATIDTQAFSVGIAMELSGTGGLTKVGSGTLTLSGSNSFVGDTFVSEGTLLLTDGSEMRFLIEDGDASNQIFGTGILDLDGIFTLDITGLSDTTGTWSLVAAGTLAETYGGSFGLAFVGGPTFTADGFGNYTSGNWTYSQLTGNLDLVPEPGTASLVLGGVVIAFFRRRRGRAC